MVEKIAATVLIAFLVWTQWFLWKSWPTYGVPLVVTLEDEEGDDD